MRRKMVWFMAMLLTANLLIGCSSGKTETTPEPAPSEAVEKEEGAPEAAEEPEAGDEEQPSKTSAGTGYPVTGIGTQISTDVEAKESYKIAIIVKNSTNPYQTGCMNGVKKAAEDMGFEAITMAPSTDDSVEEQVKIMEDLIETGVDGFVLVPVDSNGIMPGVRKAQEAGIPVACIGTPAAEETFLRTGVDYTETGRIIAGMVAEKLEGKGEVIILEGPAGAQNAIERLNGINEVLGEYPDIEIVASQTANFKRTEGMNVTENLIQRYKDVDAIIGMNDESALGAFQALKAAGMEDVLIAGFDCNQDACAAIQNGELFASYNTDPYGSCYLAATYIVQYLNDGTTPEKYFMPFPTAADDPITTIENVENYMENIAWWK